MEDFQEKNLSVSQLRRLVMKMQVDIVYLQKTMGHILYKNSHIKELDLPSVDDRSEYRLQSVDEVAQWHLDVNDTDFLKEPNEYWFKESELKVSEKPEQSNPDIIGYNPVTGKYF